MPWAQQHHGVLVFLFFFFWSPTFLGCVVALLKSIRIICSIYQLSFQYRLTANNINYPIIGHSPTLSPPVLHKWKWKCHLCLFCRWSCESVRNIWQYSSSVCLCAVITFIGPFDLKTLQLRNYHMTVLDRKQIILFAKMFKPSWVLSLCDGFMCEAGGDW